MKNCNTDSPGFFTKDPQTDMQLIIAHIIIFFLLGAWHTYWGLKRRDKLRRDIGLFSLFGCFAVPLMMIMWGIVGFFFLLGGLMWIEDKGNKISDKISDKMNQHKGY